MLDPTNRFATLVLAAGAVVLLAAIGIGQRMGDRVLGQATEHALPSIQAVVTPEPYASSGPYGPDWKRSETLSAASDPRFPDPRIPPQPLPTLPPTPKPTATATPTINPNVPIWRQKPLPTATPYQPPTEGPTESPSSSPSPSPL
ncbi:MAG TPA: hypothetical protein VGG89_08370 [Candidatus Baltobacteraceae bacterium]|jgi:hypothetical protein